MTAVRPVLALAVVLALAACGEDDRAPVPPAPQPAGIVLHVAPDLASVFDGWTDGLEPHVQAVAVADPVAAVARGAADAVRVALVAGPACAECYRIDRIPGGWRVSGGRPRGVQYGAAHLLEGFGFRFFHPWRTLVPAVLPAAPAGIDLGRLYRPEMTRRGLQLHTLHPIEGYFDVWEPGEANLAGARRIVDWLVRNRGNFLQWVGLDQYQSGTADPAAWRTHTRAVLDHARRRGVETGLAIQLFGRSNLQKSFDLLETDADIGNARAVIRDRLAAVFPALPFDHLNLNFGEFFGNDPDLTVAMIDLTRAVLDELAPATEMSATIHVGNDPDLRVDYRGENLLFYFLVKFADPRVVPWVHTVMYYELFGDAGGAYRHDDFAEHAAFLLDRLRNRQPVAFFPESAYWVTFDNSVPFFAPVYVRTRWQELADLRARTAGGGFAPLAEHILFSSGWEWGYWLNDVTVLHQGYTFPAHWSEAVRRLYAPLGPAGDVLARATVALADLQHEYLIGRRLAAYLAGRDALIDAGERAGIRAQPFRPAPNQVARYGPAALGAFRQDVLDPLGALATGIAAIEADLAAAGLPPDDPWVAEVVDGVAITALRARFIAAIYGGAAAAAAGEPGQPRLAEATALLEAARGVVARRHARLHDPWPPRLTERRRNATVYPFGYLHHVDTLCYWQRELVQLRNALRQPEPVPTCYDFNP